MSELKEYIWKELYKGYYGNASTLEEDLPVAISKATVANIISQSQQSLLQSLREKVEGLKEDLDPKSLVQTNFKRVGRNQAIDDVLSLLEETDANK